MQERERPQYKIVNVNDVKPGPIRREELPPDLYERARRVYELTCEVHYSTFEEFETNFRRDLDPQSEIRVWEQIASAFLAFTLPRRLPLKRKKAVFMELVLRTTLPDDGGDQSFESDENLSAKEKQLLWNLYLSGH